ncbi:MAG TPA: cupin domain-containing protein [Thermoanaerobaculia bacterium]|nr:cupin domain-containing protein [Thermoanaerobaculia bacterium]
MPSRPEELIRLLDLKPHPEGGFYAEVYRSSSPVTTAAGSTRPALSTIHFLLTIGQKSRWHRVDADEAWHFYEGAPLNLYWAHDLRSVHRASVGPPDVDRQPVAVVPAGAWQAAHSTGEYTLVGCSVAPGFDFAGFRLLADHEGCEQWMRDCPPELARYL